MLIDGKAFAQGLRTRVAEGVAALMAEGVAKPGLATVLIGQRVGSNRYFDAAGFEGRTVGLEERKKAASR